MMRSYLDGAILRPVEKGHSGSVKELARRFLVYGAYAEIFARDTGFNRGMGGSMHAFFTPFGIYPNNAIVGGSGSIAPGAALFKRVNRKPGIVVCNIGDASFGCGPVWEGITFASMDQYRKLWDPALGGGLPIIFNCMDNFYGMGGQPWGETMGCQFIARIGRRGQSGADARRAGQRLRSAARHRRLQAQEADSSWRARARSCSTRSPTASAGTRRRTPPATAPRRKSRSGSKADSIVAFHKKLVDSGHFSGAALDDVRAERRVGASSRCSSSRPTSRPRPESASTRTWSSGSCSPTGGWRSATTATPELLQPLSGEPAGPADPRQDPHAHVRGQAGSEDEGVQRPRRASSRRWRTASRIDPTHGRLRRGEPRLGRRVRRLPRPDGTAPLPSSVQLARSPKPPSSAPPWATAWRAAGPSPS